MIKFATSFLRLHAIPLGRFTAASRIKNRQNRIPKEQEELFLEELKSTYKLLAEDIEDEESVLNLVEKPKGKSKDAESELDETEKTANYLNQINSSFRKYYEKLSPEEQALRSKDLIKAVSLNKDWAARYELNSDYADYSLFDKNLLQIKTAPHGKFDHETQYSEFLGNLDKKVRERSQQERLYSYIYKKPNQQQRLAEDGSDLSVLNASSSRPSPLQDDQESGPEDERPVDIDSLDYTQDGEMSGPEDDWDIKPTDIHDLQNDDDIESTDNKLSFQAKFELFDLFNQGWSVRDLSLRFGILPNRVKAIVYQKRYFFDEVFPVISLETMKALLMMEQYADQINGAVDYGVDLQDMAEAQQGYLQTNFRNAHRNVDVKMLDEKEQQRLKALWDKKRLPKKEVVTEKFIGEGNRGYYVKSLIFNRTSSKHGVSKMFKRVIQNSDKPHKLPHSVQDRLKLGPRLAGAKFGHK